MLEMELARQTLSKLCYQVCSKMNLCGCGCGKELNVPDTKHKSRLNKFIRGHASRLRPKRIPKLINCLCGCGDTLYDWDVINRRERKYILLHGSKQEFCSRGHDMETTRNSYRQCSICQKEVQKALHLKIYGMTLEDFNTLLEKQDSSCAICSTKDFGKKGPHVDHNHETGKVRGLLCRGCNLALGMIKDNAQTAESAAKYLSRTSL